MKQDAKYNRNRNEKNLTIIAYNKIFIQNNFNFNPHKYQLFTK